jgi:hypothetical protein
MVFRIKIKVNNILYNIYYIMIYFDKYLKYKNKYLQLKKRNNEGGG